MSKLRTSAGALYSFQAHDPFPRPKTSTPAPRQTKNCLAKVTLYSAEGKQILKVLIPKLLHIRVDIFKALSQASSLFKQLPASDALMMSDEKLRYL